MNLFALTENNNNQIIYRVPLSAGIQEQLNNVFTQQILSFFDYKEIIKFDGNYNASEGEIFSIDDYPLNPEILNSSENPINYDILDVENLEGKIKAIYSTSLQNNLPQINFQYFDSRKIIANRGINIFLSGNAYRTFDQKGINISGSLTAVFRNNSLFFSSYFNTRKFVNLIAYYQEATEQDIDDFVNFDIFNFDDEIGFKDDLNSQLRKKIKGIQQRQVLENNNANDIRNQALQFGIEIETENNQIVIPRNKSFIRNLIRFLDEDYFITPLTKRRCITNSKRVINQ